jgi:hypothetical protein
MISLDEDLTLHIELRPLGAAAARAEASTAAPGAAKSGARRASEPTPAPGDFSHKPRDQKARPIDNSDPYGP